MSEGIAHDLRPLTILYSLHPKRPYMRTLKGFNVNSITHSHYLDWLLFKVPQLTRKTSSVTFGIRNILHFTWLGLAGKTEFDDAKAAMICEAAEEAFLTLTWKISWEFAHDQNLEKRVTTSVINILPGIYFIFSTIILILSSPTIHEFRRVSFSLTIGKGNWQVQIRGFTKISSELWKTGWRKGLLCWWWSK